MDIPDSFIDPITLSLMNDPVSTADGHVYDRASIELWLRTHDTSPVSNQVLSSKELQPADTIRQEIEEYFEKAPIHYNDLVLGGVLGEGSAKTVMEASWKGRKVAVMKFHKGDIGSEAEIFKKLSSHPHLLHYYGRTGEGEEGTEIMVTEFAPRGSLCQVLSDCEGAVSVPVKVEICRQICDGCKRIAAEGLIHRDLAARNIMVFSYHTDDCAATRVKVSDYGLTKAVRGQERYYYGGDDALPFRWMAPESCKRRQWSEKSDVWSFGVTMWEIFSDAELPFSLIASDADVAKKVMNGERLEIPDNCPDEMYELMKACWADKPVDRPTFDKLSHQLEALSAKFMTTAKTTRTTSGAVTAEEDQIVFQYIFPPLLTTDIRRLPPVSNTMTVPELALTISEKEGTWLQQMFGVPTDWLVRVHLYDYETGHSLVPKDTNRLQDFYDNGPQRVYCVPYKIHKTAVLDNTPLDPDKGAVQLFCKSLEKTKTFSIMVDLDKTTVWDLKRKIFSKDQDLKPSMQRLSTPSKPGLQNDVQLGEYGVGSGSTILVTVGRAWNTGGYGWESNFSVMQASPIVAQTEIGYSAMCSCLYVLFTKFKNSYDPHEEDDTADAENAGKTKVKTTVTTASSNLEAKKLMGHIRRLCNFPPLNIALQKLVQRETITPPEKTVIFECLYHLFRALVPRTPESVPQFVSIRNDQIFENSQLLWGFLYECSVKTDADLEKYKNITLNCPVTGAMLKDPVRIPDHWAPLKSTAKQGTVYERQTVEKKAIEDGLDMKAIIPASDYAKLVKLATSDEFIKFMGENMSNSTGSVTVPILPCSWQELQAKVKNHELLHVFPPLGLKSIAVRPPKITYTMSKAYGIFTDRGKGTDNPLILFDPLSGRSDPANPDDLARKINNLSRGSNKVYTTTREPKEAICVLLDVSASMTHEGLPPGDDYKLPSQWKKTKHSSGNYYYENTVTGDAQWGRPGIMTRCSLVKQLFNAFSNRSMAYDYPHCIGLVLFGSSVREECPMTEIFEDFREVVDDSEADEGQTLLYDALWKGADILKEFTKNYPNCIKRILCLTDGDDNGSSKSAHQVAKHLQTQHVIVDCVVVGTEDVGHVMRGITTVTGGSCFNPNDETNAFRLFEMETVLSVRQRQQTQVKPTVNNAKQLEAHCGLNNFDATIKHQFPNSLQKPVVLPQTVLNIAATRQAPTQRDAAKRVRRILKELQNYQRDPHPKITVYPTEEKLDFWRLLVVGPEGTPYEGGVFCGYIQFGDGYPLEPPEVRFVTPIMHCNINSQGRVCHSVFGRNYTQDMNLKTIFSCMYGLLLTPEPDDPLDSILAEQFLVNQTLYNENALKHTMKHANKTLTAWKKELVGEDTHDEDDTASTIDQTKIKVPSHLLCTLTNEPFVCAVMAPSGETYDKAAIISYINNHDGKDPNGNGLTENQLIPNIALQKAVEELAKGESVSKAWWND